VHEHIVAAVSRLDETEALLSIEPFHDTGRHDFLSETHNASCARATSAQTSIQSLYDVLGKGAGSDRDRKRLRIKSNRVYIDIIPASASPHFARARRRVREPAALKRRRRAADGEIQHDMRTILG
jgi:hypothetical protein